MNGLRLDPDPPFSAGFFLPTVGCQDLSWEHPIRQLTQTCPAEPRAPCTSSACEYWQRSPQGRAEHCPRPKIAWNDWEHKSCFMALGAGRGRTESPGARVGARIVRSRSGSWRLPARKTCCGCTHTCPERGEVVCCEQPDLQQLQEGTRSRAMLGPCAH